MNDDEAREQIEGIAVQLISSDPDRARSFRSATDRLFSEVRDAYMDEANPEEAAIFDELSLDRRFRELLAKYPALRPHSPGWCFATVIRRLRELDENNPNPELLVLSFFPLARLLFLLAALRAGSL